MSIKWEDLKEEDLIPVIIKSPGLSDLVRFAAGNGDFNPLHHDYNSREAKAIGSILVHGHYKYAAFGQLISDWIGHGGRIKKISCKHVGMDFPGERIKICGKIDKKKEEDKNKSLELSLWTENSKGDKTTIGNAVVIVN